MSQLRWSTPPSTCTLCRIPKERFQRPFHRRHPVVCRKCVEVWYTAQAEIRSEHPQETCEPPVAYIEVCLNQEAQHNVPPGYSGSAVPPLPVMHP